MNVLEFYNGKLTWSHVNQVINHDTPNKNPKYLWY